jgi:hypothetical protein
MRGFYRSVHPRAAGALPRELVLTVPLRVLVLLGKRAAACCRARSADRCAVTIACADGRGGAASGQQQSSVRQHSMLTFRPTRDGGTLCCAVRCGAVRCGAVLAYPHAMPSTVAVRRARSASHRRMMRASMQWSRRASQRGTGPIDCSTRVSLTVLLLLGTWCFSTTYCL